MPANLKQLLNSQLEQCKISKLIFYNHFLKKKKKHPEDIRTLYG